MTEKQILSQLFKIEKEERRRIENNRLLTYNVGEKVHKKQMAFHRCLKRNRWVFGGNRSGKTECGAVEAVWWARDPSLQAEQTRRRGMDSVAVLRSAERRGSK